MDERVSGAGKRGVGSGPRGSSTVKYFPSDSQTGLIVSNQQEQERRDAAPHPWGRSSSSNQHVLEGVGIHHVLQSLLRD